MQKADACLPSGAPAVPTPLRTGLRIALGLLALPLLLAAQNFQPTITPTSPAVIEGDTIALTASAPSCLDPLNEVVYTVVIEPLTAQPSDIGPPNPAMIAFGGNSGFVQNFDVPTLPDTEVEPDETFRIRIVPLPGQTLNCVEPGPLTPVEDSVVATILNDDLVMPVLSIADFADEEGDSGTSDAQLLVTLSPAVLFPVTVAYGTAPGTASSGLDYQSSAGTLTFSPGETIQLIRVPVVGETR